MILHFYYFLFYIYFWRRDPLSVFFIVCLLFYWWFFFPLRSLILSVLFLLFIYIYRSVCSLCFFLLPVHILSMLLLQSYNSSRLRIIFLWRFLFWRLFYLRYRCLCVCVCVWVGYSHKRSGYEPDFSRSHNCIYRFWRENLWYRLSFVFSFVPWYVLFSLCGLVTLLYTQ